MSTVAIIAISGGYPGTIGGYIPFSSDYKPPRSAEWTSRWLSGNSGSAPFYRVRSRGELVDAQTMQPLPSKDLVWNHGKYKTTFHVDQLENGFDVYDDGIEYWHGIEYDNGGHKKCYRRTGVSGNQVIYKEDIYYRRGWTTTYVYDYSLTGLYKTGTDLIDVSEPPTEKPFYDFFLSACEAGYIHPSYQQYFSRAFMDAASALPQADVNLIGNIKEAFDYIKGAIKFLKSPASSLGDLFQSFADPKNLWLQYRYVYKTNQLDASELENLVSRLDYLSACAEAAITTEAYVTESDTRFGVTMRFPISSILPNDVMSLVKMFGAQVTPSNIWDMIPFSFMVDWFAGIGDKLSFFEDWAETTELTPEDIWYIVRKKYDWGDVYVRIPGHKPCVPPVYTSKTASGKTVMMRVADTVSIFS